MTFVNQPIWQFVILTACGLVAVGVGTALVVDYRGLLTRYAHSLWESYQRPWYQRLFVWTDKQRQRLADERRIRTWVRVPAGILCLMGFIFLFFEIGALATGHVG
jgi:hypothetical protein